MVSQNPMYPGSSVESCQVTKRSHHSSSGQARRALSSMSMAAPNCCHRIALQVMIFMVHLWLFHTRQPGTDVRLMVVMKMVKEFPDGEALIVHPHKVVRTTVLDFVDLHVVG